jgi:hypothetical protein
MFAIIFNCFWKYFRCTFQVFHLSFFLYIVSVASGCFKSKSSVAHEVRVEAGARAVPARVTFRWCG